MNKFKAKEHTIKLCTQPQDAYEAAITYCLTNLI